eukprot:scaffold133449_cov59-Phaeocystis_antarctica.AAC.2
MPSQRRTAGRRPLAPDPQPVLMGRGPISTPRRPLLDLRATSLRSRTTAPRAPTLAWALAPRLCQSSRPRQLPRPCLCHSTS